MVTDDLVVKHSQCLRSAKLRNVWSERTPVFTVWVDCHELYMLSRLPSLTGFRSNLFAAKIKHKLKNG